MTKVWPIAPPAPGRFSMKNCWPRIVLTFSATMRAPTSSTVPAPAATTILTGFVGYGSAARAEKKMPASAASKMCRRPLTSNCTLLDADMRVVNDLAPFRLLAPDALAELVGRAGDGIEAERFELLLHVREDHEPPGRGLERRDDALRRAGRHHHGGQRVAFVTRNAGFGRGRHIGMHGPPPLAQDGERA